MKRKNRNGRGEGNEECIVGIDRNCIRIIALSKQKPVYETHSLNRFHFFCFAHDIFHFKSTPHSR